MSEEEYATIDQMLIRGGAFARCLARAARVADPDNRRRIRDAFPEIWEKYSEWGSESPSADAKNAPPVPEA